MYNIPSGMYIYHRKSNTQSHSSTTTHKDKNTTVVITTDVVY